MKEIKQRQDRRGNGSSDRDAKSRVKKGNLSIGLYNTRHGQRQTKAKP